METNAGSIDIYTNNQQSFEECTVGGDICDQEGLTRVMMRAKSATLIPNSKYMNGKSDTEI